MKINYSTRVKAPNITSLEIAANQRRKSIDIDDAQSSNQMRRDLADGRNTQEKTVGKLAQAKKPLQVGTLNVRTIKSEYKQLELSNICSEVGVDILGIIDHKIVHDDELEFTSLGKYKLITTSAWRSQCNAALGGVGILLNSKAENALADVKSFNSRIMIAQFGGNPATTIIVHYAPVEGADDAEEHYSKLTDAIKTVPAHNMLLVVGDCNAHVGADDAPFSFHEQTNRNGKLLLELAQETNLDITNTRFQKKKGKLWTFLSDMSGTKSQIDFILINQKWRNSVRNVEAYNIFSSLGSDHRVLTARVNLSLRISATPPKKVSYDWSSLKSHGDLQQLYTVEVKNRFNELQEGTESITQLYQHLITANTEAAEKLIPKKKRKIKKNQSKDPRVVQARTKIQQVFEHYQNKPDEDQRINLETAKKSLQEIYLEIADEELNNMIDEINSADTMHNHQNSWKLVNEISGRKKAKTAIIKGKSKKERVENWHNHFSKLLGKEPSVEEEDEEIKQIFGELPIKTGPFEMEEYKKIKKKMKTGKAAGPDGIPPEVLKLCDLDDTILEFANKFISNLEKPDQWSENNLIPIPKSGNLSLVDNYRGISLSQITLKAINSMLLNRIKPVFDPLLRPNQNGFRSGRSTKAQILTLRRIIEGVKAQNLQAVITFIDFSKAFDSIHRGKMLKILLAYGIPPQLVEAIGKIYEDTRARVITPDGETEFFSISAGVLQGDTLAPYLFIIVLDYVLREAINGREDELGFTIKRRQSRRVPAIKITDLDFADDIALLSDEIQQAQQLLQQIEISSAKVGLHLNAKKTEYMSYNQPINIELKTRRNTALKAVGDFKYLGAWMSCSEKDINIRKAQAWTACHKMRKIWTSKLPRKTKIRLFQSTVESVLLYNSETWTLTKQLEKGIDGTYTRMLRTALNVKWQQHMTNEELYGNLPKVSKRIQERRLRLSGHCIRHKEEEGSKVILWDPIHGHPNRGRRKITYINNIKADTGLETNEELRTAMMDRDTWKDFIRLARGNSRPK